jgi:aldehyde:ferredoxin oxidoreductase
MSVSGTMGKMAVADLGSQQVSLETPDDDLYLTYLGGCGLAAHYLDKVFPINRRIRDHPNTANKRAVPHTMTTD